jgi:hypothetical protein
MQPDIKSTQVSRKMAWDLDKFYTPNSLVLSCMERIGCHIPRDVDTLYLEPSAGNGAFCSVLPEGQCVAIDIAPEAAGIVRQDFLVWRPSCPRQRFVTVGNPPFSGGLALKFFNHAALFSSHIAMILPASFGRKEMQNKVDRHFHLLHETLFADAQFSICGAPHKVSVVFQIWEWREELRPLVDRRKTHPDFKIVLSPAEADLVLRRVGARAGEVVAAGDIAAGVAGVSKNSNFYIRAERVTVAELLTRFRACDFKGPRSMGIHASINRADIVAAYESAKAAEVYSKEVCF